MPRTLDEQAAGWVAAEALLAPASPLLDRQLAAAAAALGGAPPEACASVLAEGYAEALATVAFRALVGARQAPDLAAANVALRFGPGGTVEAVALRGQEAARAASAGGEPALAAWAGSQLLREHLNLLVAALGARRLRRGPRALRGLIANGYACAVAEVVRGGSEAAAALAAPFLEPLARWVPARPRLLVLPGGDVVRKRVTCCLFYRLPGNGYCATCPLLASAETVRRLAGPRAPAPLAPRPAR